MILDIIIRTHSESNVHPQEQRVQTDSKEEMLIHCVYSLILSINNCQDHDIKVTVLDDHSSASCITKLKKILGLCRYPTELIHLEGRGNNASLKSCYEYARDHARDVIYFVEDDYLHYPSAISEMIESYETFKHNLGGKEVGILPNDDPDNYKAQWIKPSRIVLGRERHWRTNDFALGTFMVSKTILLTQYDIFMEFSHYGKSPDIVEETTINKLWKGPAILFTPIPALALHMHHNYRIIPFTDWEQLWNSIDISGL
jgi:hypothetical protein